MPGSRRLTFRTEEDPAKEQSEVRDFACGRSAVRLRGTVGKLEESREAQWLQSYTIITTDPNELMESINTRMPVILHPKDYDRWLSREATEQPPLDLLRPYEADAMAAKLTENTQEEIFVEPNSR